MRENSRIALAILLIVIVTAAGISGCAGSSSRKTQDKSINPFTTDHVATVRILMKEKDWSFCRTNAFDEQYVPADFWFDDELIPDVGVRPKGNSSLGQAVGWNSPRLPLAIDFNLFNRARTFHGVKKVVLNNGWSDPTLIREVIGYEVFRKMDIPTPRASIVDVWVNDNHLGVYTMAEAVDQAFLQRHFTNATGNLYKPELVAARLDWTEADAEKPLTSMFIPPQEHPLNTILYSNLGGAGSARLWLVRVV